MHPRLYLHSRYSFALSNDTPKADMAGGCVDRLGVACGGTVTPAVVRCAEMGAALDHLAGNLDVRLAGIVACGLGASAGVFRDTAGFRRIGLMLLGVPVGGPLPDIADHVVNAIAVWRERGDRRCALEAVVVQVLPRKFT